MEAKTINQAWLTYLKLTIHSYIKSYRHVASIILCPTLLQDKIQLQWAYIIKLYILNVEINKHCKSFYIRIHSKITANERFQSNLKRNKTSKAKTFLTWETKFGSWLLMKGGFFAKYWRQPTCWCPTYWCGPFESKSRGLNDSFLTNAPHPKPVDAPSLTVSRFF
jgi:hypothetical protein